MEKLEIAKGGRLLETRWTYDEVLEKGQYVTENVTEYAPTKMFEACTLADDVTLRDVFLLLRCSMTLYKAIIGNWVEEIVTEGLDKPPTGAFCCGGDDRIDYLELCWQIEYDRAECWLAGNIRPDFHGVGPWPMEANKDSVAGPCSVAFMPANEIIDLPLQLSPELLIYPTIREHHDFEQQRFFGPEFSLGQILYAIIWELSWFGPPQFRDEKAQEVSAARDEVLAGARTTSWDEAMEQVLDERREIWDRLVDR